MKRVFSSYNQHLVHHWRNVLEAEGIAAEVRNERLSSGMGELPPSECQAELWVLDARHHQRAEELLHANVPSGPDWDCTCGETLGGQFTQCWQCGAFRPTGSARS